MLPQIASKVNTHQPIMSAASMTIVVVVSSAYLILFSMMEEG
jgi:predicted permease